MKPDLSAPEFGVHRNKLLSVLMTKRGGQFRLQDMPEKAWGGNRWATEGLTENLGGSRHLLLTPTASDLTRRLEPGCRVGCRGLTAEGDPRKCCLAGPVRSAWSPEERGWREGGLLSEGWCRGAGMSLSCICWEAPVDTPRPSKETGLLGASGHFFEASWALEKREGHVLGAKGLRPGLGEGVPQGGSLTW